MTIDIDLHTSSLFCKPAMYDKINTSKQKANSTFLIGLTLAHFMNRSFALFVSSFDSFADTVSYRLPKQPSARQRRMPPTRGRSIIDLEGWAFALLCGSSLGLTLLQISPFFDESKGSGIQNQSSGWNGHMLLFGQTCGQQKQCMRH